MLTSDHNITTQLLDALHKTIVNPTASHQWHALQVQYDAQCNNTVLRYVEKNLLAQIPRKGVEGFLMMTFLAGNTGDMGYISEAGQIVQEITPFDMDRLAAFAVYEWGRALASAGDRFYFVNAMRKASIPEIMRIQGEYLMKQIPLCLNSRVITRVNKVAMVVSYLSDSNHTPTMIALQQAHLLVGLGFEVQIFSSQELRIANMPHYLGNQGNLLTPPMNVAELQKIIPDGVAVTFCDEQFSLLFRSRQILGKIAEFDPDLVFFVGFNSPLLAPLYYARPVLGLCVHSVPPMAPVDAWLAANLSLADQLSQVWGDSMPDAFAFYHPYRISLKPVYTVLSRSALDLAQEDLVIVSVGARLEKEICGDWAVQIGELVQRHPSAVWVLVGGEGVLPSALAQMPAAKIRLLPHHADVRSVYRCCDVYVNPPRLGGGFSVAEAMAEGLPIVAFADSDGGDKLGDYAVETMADYVDTLNALLASANLRKENGAAMREIFLRTLDLEQSGPSLLAACKLSLARYQQRISH